MDKVKPQGKIETKYLLNAVPLFKVGKWKGLEFSMDDLIQMRDNTQAMLNGGIIKAPATPGHVTSQFNIDTGAIGWLSRVFIVGDQLFGDFNDIDKNYYNAILQRKYDNVSIELDTNFVHPATQTPIGKLIKAVAFEGGELPAVKGNGGIIYHSDKKDDIKIIFKEQNLMEANRMMWKIAEVTKAYPCCIAEVQKFMDENKLTEISQEKLAEIIATKNMTKYADPVQADTIVCPDGYEWNAEKEICTPKVGAKVNVPEQKVCPKGFQYDEGQQKCVPVQEDMKDDKKNVNPDLNPDVTPKAAKQDPAKKEPKKIGEFSEDPKTWTPEEIDMACSTYKGLKPEQKTEFETMADDKRPPKGWFDSCVSAVGSKSDNPQALCGWVYAHGMSPEAKQKAESTRQSETEQSKYTEKVNALQTEILKLQKEKLSNIVKEFKASEKDIIVPALHPYIDVLVEKFSEIDATVKFGEKDQPVLDVFIGLLKEISKSKRVIFGELTKTNNEKEGDEKMDEIKFTEKEVSDTKLSFSEISKENRIHNFSNVELGILANKIASSEKISLKEAGIKAAKILRAEEK